MEKGLWQKNFCLISVLLVVSKVFEKLVNKMLVDHVVKCGLFSDFQHGFMSSRSTANLLVFFFFFPDQIGKALIGMEIIEL